MDIRPPPPAREEADLPPARDRAAENIAVEDALLVTLGSIWAEVSGAYDVVSPMPDPAVLFASVLLEQPGEAAVTVLGNMLLEVMEGIDRFSPWYTRPPRAFGLTAELNEASQRLSWRLTEKGAKRWLPQINTLQMVITQESGLIRAMLFVEGLLETAVAPEDGLVLACCQCLPARHIRVKKAILAKTEILCDICRQPFFPADC